jgi:hypothetical protein
MKKFSQLKMNSHSTVQKLHAYIWRIRTNIIASPTWAYIQIGDINKFSFNVFVSFFSPIQTAFHHQMGIFVFPHGTHKTQDLDL